MKNKNYRYYLQVQFKDNSKSRLVRFWDINEPYTNLNECEGMAKNMLDASVERMRIVDGINNTIVKLYR